MSYFRRLTAENQAQARAGPCRTVLALGAGFLSEDITFLLPMPHARLSAGDQNPEAQSHIKDKGLRPKSGLLQASVNKLSCNQGVHIKEDEMGSDYSTNGTH